ncbi:MAG: LON peptidase substrate-binding domain-containing protein [Planctomycetes bacterium]|nr:LON peptidase substrate-binding domain-containing protein [Planctomycetota bacterium]
MGHWESAGLPDDFTGSVRLFPLPNLVLFPHVIQALHIFEPRYCEMLTEALESDHLITMALLTPGWEQDFQGKPTIGDVVCIGRIISHTPTDDGRHNILLAGVSRARILRELDVPTSFRQAHVELIEEYIPKEFEPNIEEYRARLLSIFRAMIPEDAANSKTFGDILTQQLPLGILTDIIAYAVNLPPDVKQSLLGEPNIIARYELLMTQLNPDSAEELPLLKASSQYPSARRGSEFPPRFSDN